MRNKYETFNTFLLAPNCPKVELMMFRVSKERRKEKKRKKTRTENTVQSQFNLNVEIGVGGNFYDFHLSK